ncbi:hypothetical protein ATO12_04220 [Aquimarina atlantica]|uniref:Uncharacterized protein n=1 Tax=Aquimarina atlantica TaxID=1317122 RepID=A0A023C112_9FLAO|nr:hypothetical protein [Aquimarina atlantica]EZH76002.1 hypothetical protein ATO12_04220 [Aquimarina atlantica]
MTQSINSSNITPITISNNLFMCGKDQWAPKGVCYQPTDFVDPISDNNLTVIQNLLKTTTTYGFTNMKINAIRVYQVDPTKDHTKVMNALAAAGIYVLVGAVDHTTVHDGPTIYNARLKAVADEFCKYQNVLGFSIGNETIDPGAKGQNPGYDIPNKIRAGAKYLKAYMAKNCPRVVPVTAALRDDPDFTIPAAKAYMCGDPSERLDFLGYNCERWAGGTLAAKVGAYYTLTKAFEGANPVPITFTEMGSNPRAVSPRTWEQVDYLYGGTKLTPQSGSGSPINMADVVSGGFAFRYYERNAGWGMLTTSGDEIPNHGANSIITEYSKITSFSSTGNTMGTAPCDKNNPYVKGSAIPSSGLPTAVKVTLTNSITNPASGRNIKFNYTSNLNAANPTWIEAVAIKANGPKTTFTFPKGTNGISMIYEVDSKWNQGCQLSGQALLQLADGDTIEGNWMSPDGNGNCAIS